MRRKITLSLAAAAAVALALTSCSTAESGTEANGKTSITFDYWGSDSEVATIKSMVSAFESKYPNISVTQSFTPGDTYLQKLQTQIAANKAPTVAVISNTDLGSYTSAFIPVDLDSSKFSSSSLTTLMKATDGKYYATPFVAKTKVLAYNAKDYKAAGIQEPSATTPMTTDQFIANAKKLTNGSGTSKKYGSAPLWYTGWMVASGGQLFSADGKQCLVGSSAAITAANQVIAAQQSNGYAPTPSAAQGQDMFQWLSIGRVAMQPDFGPWSISQLASLSNASDFQIAPDPGKGEPIEVDGLGISTQANSAQVTAAKKFTAFMSTSDDAQNLLTTKTSSLGVPVTKSAQESFLKVDPNLNLSAFVTAIGQSESSVSVKNFAQITNNVGTGLTNDTALGTGKGNPSTVLPQLQQQCQSALEAAQS